MTRSCLATLRLTSAVAAVLCGGATGCTSKQAPKVPLGQAAVGAGTRAEESAHALLGPAAKAALDSGNALFRKQAYTAALAQYRAAAALAPQHAAPLFGIYMVGRATNNSAMADSAMVGIRLRSGPMPTPPHSMDDTALKRLHDAVRAKSSSG